MHTFLSNASFWSEASIANNTTNKQTNKTHRKRRKKKISTNRLIKANFYVMIVEVFRYNSGKTLNLLVKRERQRGKKFNEIIKKLMFVNKLNRGKINCIKLRTQKNVKIMKLFLLLLVFWYTCIVTWFQSRKKFIANTNRPFSRNLHDFPVVFFSLNISMDIDFVKKKNKKQRDCSSFNASNFVKWM